MAAFSGYAIGLAASALLDLPSGALIVWSLAVLAVMMEFVGSLRSIR